MVAFSPSEWSRLRDERVDDRNQNNEPKSREHTSHNGKFEPNAAITNARKTTKYTRPKSKRSSDRNIGALLFHQKGSSNGHSPVLNLSKSGGIDQGSTGDQSDRSENASPAPSMRDEDENMSEDNLSEVDERGAKDDGNLPENCLPFRQLSNGR